MSETDRKALQEKVEKAQLDADLAKLALIVAQYQNDFDDPRLTLRDIASIRQCAKQFGVHERAAYLRALSLGLLSYQSEECDV